MTSFDPLEQPKILAAISALERAIADAQDALGSLKRAVQPEPRVTWKPEWFSADGSGHLSEAGIEFFEARCRDKWSAYAISKAMRISYGAAKYRRDRWLARQAAQAPQ